MAKMEELKEIVGDLMKVDSQALAKSTVLSGLLASSIGRARLDATLRARLGTTNPGVYSVGTFGELCVLLSLEGAGDSGVATADSRPSIATANFSGRGIALGVDIQAVAALPEAADYWEGDFYQQHFTRQEIGYALLQPDPRESLAAAWCAKEALRKADSRWAGIDWKLTEITHDAEGRPALQSGDEAIPCAVSLSHTNGFAVAVVAMTEISPPTQRTIAIASESVVLPIVEGRGGRSGLSVTLSVVALLVSLVTAAYAILR
jgi:holo-[acyl-carrier protein] synthase